MNTELLHQELVSRPLKILYLEDEPRDRELVGARLLADGLQCEFIFASKRDEFESGLAEPRLDLILSDFSLPSYHGTAALAAAHHRRPEVPFLFVSGTIGEERAVESLKSGATDYVIKNRLERLAPAIRRALRESVNQTLRRGAEEALRESEERFRLVFESAPIGVICSDSKGKIFRTNRTLQQMLGYTEEELLHINAYELTHEEDHERCRGALAELIEGRAKRVRVEKRYYRKDRSVLWVQLTASAIWDNHGRLVYVIALLEDLSERKQAEEHMRDQARLLDMAEDAIIVMDAGGRTISWNNGAQRLFGWSSQEVIGRQITEFLYRDASVYDALKQGLLKDGDWGGEVRLHSRDGREVIVNSRATLMRDEAGKPKSVLVINTDVTEKKKLELQFLRAQRMESIGTLASGIAHDLNNILAPISIAAQILRMTSTDSETLELVGRIESSAHRGADVVRQVLTFARGIEGERAQLQLKHLIKEVIKIMEQTFPKSINITYSLGEDLWPVVGDATQLHQVILNLCVNARDAMPQGGELRLTAQNVLVEDTSMLIPGAKAGPYAVLQIKDTGAGIPPDIMDKIFEPFFTTKELGKGTGLGLSTVLGIVKSHGGTVNVYSEPGKGSLFKIYLPAISTTVAEPARKTPTKLPKGNGELILLVEDEAPLRDVTRKILVRHGYNVLTAGDGAEALAMYAQHAHNIDLILTDMMMPRMEGIAMIRALKTLDPKLKIIATSGLANLADENGRTKELKSLGVNFFLQKPCTPERLLTSISETLA